MAGRSPNRCICAAKEETKARNPNQHIEPLAAAAADMRGKAAAANICYDLARALLRAAPRARDTRRKYQRIAADLLNTSLASGHLGTPREHKASTCLEAMEP